MTGNSMNEQKKSSRVKREINFKPVIESISFKTGSWSDEELSNLIRALNIFKWGQWAEMSSIVKTRSVRQVKYRVLEYSQKAPTENLSQVEIDLHIIASTRRKEYFNEVSTVEEEARDKELGGPFNSNENLNSDSKIEETKEIDTKPQLLSRIWNESEIAALLKGLENHKWLEWEEIAKYVETKTVFQVQNKLRTPILTLKTEMPKVMSDLKLLIEQRRMEYEDSKRKGSTDTKSHSSNSSKSKISARDSISETGSFSNSSSSSFDSVKIKILTRDESANFENEIKPSQEEIIPTPLTNPANDEDVVMERVVEAVGVVVDNEYTMMENDYQKKDIELNGETVEKIEDAPNTIKNEITDEITENPLNNEIAGKRVRKSPITVSKPSNSKTVSKTAAVTATPTPAKKRTYTRKSRTMSTAETSVNVGEEVSILSSSSSGEFERDSINIMSSSSSSNDGITSVSSVSSEKESLKSRTSSKSIASVKSVVSDSSSIASISEWEKASCPAIFQKPNVVEPEARYLRLKRSVIDYLSMHPGISDETICNRFNGEHGIRAIKQVIEILRANAESHANTDKPTVSKKKSPSAAPLEGEQQILDDYELLKKLSMTSSGRKRKIRSEEGDWIDPNEIEGRVISHEPAAPAKEKRKRKFVKKSLDGYGGEDLSTTEDPFRLILLSDYQGEHVHSHASEEYENLKAPFVVEMCSSVVMLMDLHSHLHSSEIIGLLGGTLIKTEDIPILRIEYGYPCLTAHSTGTQVDVDPLSEMEAGEFFESKHVRMTGWYHSHPNFEPNPSLRDLETQTMYQGLFRNTVPGSDIEPFVGVIVNPYLAITESSSHVECFYVAPNPDPAQERLPYRLPIHRKPFHPDAFPQLLDKMREIVFRAENSPDRLDMQRNAEPGVKRIEKLYNSLKFHGELTTEQMNQIKGLFK